MTRYWTLEPEVAGELGNNSELDTDTHPPKVTKFHFRFKGWLGDDLLEIFPCYIVTESLANEIVAENFSGYHLENVTVDTSITFQELYPEKELPPFLWLKIIGSAGHDDFGITRDNLLVISDQVLHCFNMFNLNHCEKEPYQHIP